MSQRNAQQNARKGSDFAAAVLQGPSSCHYAATNHSHISAWVFSTNKNVNIQDCVWILRFSENSAWPMICPIQN